MGEGSPPLRRINRLRSRGDPAGPRFGLVKIHHNPVGITEGESPCETPEGISVDAKDRLPLPLGRLDHLDQSIIDPDRIREHGREDPPFDPEAEASLTLLIKAKAEGFERFNDDPSVVGVRVVPQHAKVELFLSQPDHPSGLIPVDPPFAIACLQRPKEKLDRNPKNPPSLYRRGGEEKGRIAHNDPCLFFHQVEGHVFHLESIPQDLSSGDLCHLDERHILPPVHELGLENLHAPFKEDFDLPRPRELGKQNDSYHCCKDHEQSTHDTLFPHQENFMFGMNNTGITSCQDNKLLLKEHPGV